MLNLETKGSGQQQQQQRLLQHPAPEPRGEGALGTSGHHQQQQRPPQQHAQKPIPVPATATPQAPAGPGSDQAASQLTGFGYVLPAGQPAAGPKPAAAQRPPRAGKPPVAAAAAAAGQHGTARPPAEAKAALGLKRKRAQEGPAPVAGALLVASSSGTSQQPEKMRKVVPAGQVVPHAGGSQGCASLDQQFLTTQSRGSRTPPGGVVVWFANESPPVCARDCTACPDAALGRPHEPCLALNRSGRHYHLLLRHWGSATCLPTLPLSLTAPAPAACSALL